MSIIIPANSAVGGGFEVANSCRFDDGSSDYLNRTPSSAGNRRTFTFSFWVKRATLGTSQFIYNVRPGASGASQMLFASGDKLQFSFEPISKSLETNRLFRDTSAWYHIVYAFDTTQGTASNRIKLYVNGVQETSFGAANYPDQNADLDINTTNVINIGRRLETSGSFIDMYLSEFVFIDGQALDPTSFGEFDEDSGIWKPISVSGLTYGTNGFYLDFQNSGALGADVSGESNNFTVNFATLNPLASLPNTGVSTFTEGNTTSQGVNGSYVNGGSTLMMPSGKWYAEMKYVASSSASRCIVGITQDVSEISRINQDAGALNTFYTSGDGNKNIEGSTSSYGATWTTGNIIGIALDLDNNRLFFSKDGVWQNSGDPTSSTGAITGFSVPSATRNGGYFFWSGSNSNAQNNTVSWNFGNAPYSISSGNADGNDRGNFEYAVPSGYLALCTKNISEASS